MTLADSSHVYHFQLLVFAFQQAYGWMCLAKISSEQQRYCRAKNKFSRIKLVVVTNDCYRDFLPFVITAMQLQALLFFSFTA